MLRRWIHLFMHCFPFPLLGVSEVCLKCVWMVHVIASMHAHTFMLLTLVVNVLVLMHFPVHVWMCVRVYVRVDLWVDFGSQSSAPLSEEQLLMGDVVLVRKAILIPAGWLLRCCGAGSLAIGCWQTLSSRKGRRGRRRSRRRGGGAGAFWLAEPEEGGAQNEGDACRYPNNDGPGEARWCGWGDGVALGLQIW